MSWDHQFQELFNRCLDRYQSGDTDFTAYYSADDLAFLASIGYQPRELFDFIEDFAADGEPSFTSALLIAAVRRDYFLVVQHGVPSSAPKITSEDLPTYGDTLEGIVKLPRVIKKARAKLEGALDPDLMFGCGGDRKFFKDHGDIHPADFLRHVWASHDDDAKIAAWVKAQGA